MDALAEKLLHPVAEVRGRALQSLDFKLRYGLLVPDELAAERGLLSALLRLLSLGDGLQTTGVVLLTLRKVAPHPHVARALLAEGAERRLQELKANCPPELAASADALLEGLMTGGGGGSAGAYGSGGPTAAAASAGSAQQPRLAMGQSGARRALFDGVPVPEGQAANLGADGFPAAAAPWRRGPSETGGPAPGLGASPGGWAPRWDAQPHQLPPVADPAASPSSPLLGRARTAVALPHHQEQGYGQQHGMYKHHEQPPPAAEPPRPDAADARAMRARARADWRSEAAAAAAGGDGGPMPGFLSLPATPLGAADDQHLFELGVRLGYADDERLLGPALAELAGAVTADFPAEALLQRKSLLDNTLALLASPKSSAAIQSSAAELLLRLMTGLQRSLALGRDPDLSASAYGDNRATEAAIDAADERRRAAAAAGAAPQPGELLKQVLEAVRGSDPTCTDSYPPLPLPPAGLADAWRMLPGQGRERVDVTGAVHSVVLQVLDLARLPDRHFRLMPVIEAALPLLCAPLVHFAPTDVCSRDGAALTGTTVAAAAAAEGEQPALSPEAVMRLSDALQAQWRGMLAALSRALASTLAVARSDRAAAAASGDGGALAAEALATSGLVAWDLSSINLLMLALRLINEAPAEWCSPAIVPPSIADAAEAAALDEAAAMLIPGLRPAARRLLARLRPAALAVLEGAGTAYTALAAADRAAAELPGLMAAAARAGERPAAADAAARVSDDWLATAREALGALGQGGQVTDSRLVEVIVRGAAAVASIGGCYGSGADDSKTADAGALLLQLLAWCKQETPPSSAAGETVIRAPAYDLLLRLAQDAAAAGPAVGQDGATQPGVVRLLLAPKVLEHLATAGLAAPATRRAAAQLLLAALRSGGAAAVRAELPWHSWVSCHRGDPDVPGLVEALDACADAEQQQGMHHAMAPGGAQLHWGGRVASLVRGLFAQRSEDRARAGAALLRVVAPEIAEEDERDAAAGLAVGRGDPFRGLLDGGGGPGRPDPILDASPALAANFTAQDAASLLDVVHNGDLVPELRRSAAEQLLALAAAPALLAVLSQPRRLDALWRLAMPAWAMDDADTASGDAGDGSLFELQLPAAALALLFGACARSAKALEWLLSDADSLLVPLLPLVYHPLTSMRRAAARLLALAAFGPEARRWGGYARAAAGTTLGPEAAADGWGLVPPGSGAVALPAPFVEGYRFPFRTAAVPVEAVPSSLPAAWQSHNPAAAAAGATSTATAAARRLVAQQRLLQAAGGDAAAARRLLDAPPQSLDAPQPLLHATAATLAALDAGALAKGALAAVAASRSHQECGRALRALQRLASSGPGLAALLAAPWGEALGRLLCAAPANDDDQHLWLELLPLVERLLTGGPWQQAQYMHLALSIQQSALPWLRQRGACDDVGRPPLAAIEAEVGEDDVASGGALPPAARRRLRLSVSRAALRVLLQLLRAGRRCSGVEAHTTVLRALGGSTLLDLLACRVVGQEEGDPYCRALGAAALEEALVALQQLDALPGKEGVMWCDAAHAWEDGLLSCLEPLIARVAMPIAAHRAAGFRSKGLVRPVLRCLAALQRLLPVGVWSPAWATIGGTFWLSRLSRDKEASIRRSSLVLLANLLAPGTEPTQRMLLSGWPDAGARIVRVACDSYEAHGVRAAALAFVCAAAAVDPISLGPLPLGRPGSGGGTSAGDGDAAQGDKAEAAGQGGETGTDFGSAPGDLRRLHRFGLAALLQQQQLWEALPPLLAAAAAGAVPPAMAVAAASLAAQALAADPTGVGMRLLIANPSWEGLQPPIARALAAALPQPPAGLLEHLPGSGSSGAGGDSSVDIPAALAAIAKAGVAAQVDWSRGLAEDCAAHLQSLQWLAAAGGSPSEDTLPSSPGQCTWLPSGATASCSAANLATEHWQAQAAAAAAAAVQALSLAVPVAAAAKAGAGPPDGWADDAGPSQAQISALKAAGMVAARRMPELLGAALCGLAAVLPALPPESDGAVVLDSDSSSCSGAMPSGATWETLQLGRQQLAAVCAVAQALAVLLQRQTAGHRLQTVRMLQACVGPDSGGVLVAAAAVLEHPQCSEACAQTVAALVGCLLSDEECARTLLGTGAVGPTAEDDAAADDDAAPEPVCPSGDPVGAALCASLSRLVPSSFFLEGPGDEPGETTDPEATGESEANALHSPGQTACLVALRNLVAFGRSAKVAAVSIGLHAALLDSCGGLGSALAAAAAAVAAAAGSKGPISTVSIASGSRLPGAPRRRAWALPAVRAATVAPEEDKKPAAGTVPRSRAVGPTSDRAPRQEGAGTPLSLRRKARPSVASASSGVASRDASRGGGKAADNTDQQPEAGNPPSAAKSRSKEEKATTDEPSEPTTDARPETRGGSGSTKEADAVRRRQEQQAATRERKLLLCLGMLRHIAHRDGPAKEALIEAGLLWTVVGMWPVGLARPAVLCELLTLAGGLAPGSALARTALAAPAGPRMPAPLTLVLAALTSGAAQAEAAGRGGGAGGAAFTAAACALLHFGSSSDGAAALVHPGCNFLPESQRLLRGFLTRKDPARAAAILQLLAAVAAAPEGQRAMLRATAAPALLDLAVSALQEPHGGAVAAAALLLHNLAFHPDMRTPALANAQLLPLLLAAAESLQPEALLKQQQWQAAGRCCGAPAAAAAATAGELAPPGAEPPRPEFVLIGRGGGCKQGCRRATGPAAAEAAAVAAQAAAACRLQVGSNVCTAAYAAGALWALMFQGEAVKAAVRKLPGAGERLVAARAHCAHLLRALCGGGDSAGEVQVEPACPVAESGGSSGPQSAAWWLQQLEESLLAVVDLLHQPGGAAPGKLGIAAGNPAPSAIPVPLPV